MKIATLYLFLTQSGVSTELAHRAIARIVNSSQMRRPQSNPARTLITLAARHKVRLPPGFDGWVAGEGKRLGIPGSDLMEIEEEELLLMPWDSQAASHTPPGRGPIGPGELMPASRPRDPGTVMGTQARPVNPDEVMGPSLSQTLNRLAAQVAAYG
ncbi:MAG: hypothetical protein ABW095_11750 [Candidatus Thiodiazotropha sp.]